MEFPMNRQRLQDIRKEIEDDFVEKYIKGIVNDIKEQIIAHAYFPRLEHLGGISKTKLKITVTRYSSGDCLRNIWINNFVINTSFAEMLKTRFDLILNKLQTLFPDVSFQLDPLKTYILVDWS
jgi:hypothetical protein